VHTTYILKYSYWICAHYTHFETLSTELLHTTHIVKHWVMKLCTLHTFWNTEYCGCAHYTRMHFESLISWCRAHFIQSIAENLLLYDGGVLRAVKTEDSDRLCLLLPTGAPLLADIRLLFGKPEYFCLSLDHGFGGINYTCLIV